tara:strand:- start:2491 stop:4062 length:1572 start_codon:yes stop_codon:yes gene_type:complete
MYEAIMSIKDVLVPDVGGSDVDVIDVLVSVGDRVSIDDALITLESDKASMDVPSPVSGTVKELSIAIGDSVAEGTLIAKIEMSNSETTNDSKSVTENQDSKKITSSVQEILVPDVGGTAVDVIDLLVSVGDSIAADDALITLESDKASMDVPSPISGTIKEISLAVGDSVSEGTLIAKIEATGNEIQSGNTNEKKSGQDIKKMPESTARKEASSESSSQQAPSIASNFKDSVYAGPAVRRIAREFGIDLTQIKGTGEKGRISKGDVQNFVRQKMQQGGPDAAFSLPKMPEIDFTRFGDIDVQPLSKINKLTGSFLHRNWISIPHITQFDEADISEMEDFRKQKKADGIKLTPIVFVMKAVVAALKEFPRFNSSLDAKGENLVLKKYFNIGVAVDTPNGLVVPVIRDVDKKGLKELAAELGAISKKAREKGLAPTDMQGGCFSISSLGGIGGTAFTPIVNAPEVAILGLSKSQIKPVWNGKEFSPRLMLPLSLSYDHRVIDGADGARFVCYVVEALQVAWQALM